MHLDKTEPSAHKEKLPRSDECFRKQWQLSRQTASAFTYTLNPSIRGGALTIYLYQSPKKLLQHPEGPINIRRDFITTRYRWKTEGRERQCSDKGEKPQRPKKRVKDAVCPQDAYYRVTRFVMYWDGQLKSVKGF